LSVLLNKEISMSYFPLIPFEEHLREERKRAGLTQEELAQRVEASDTRMSASYVSKMETGLLPPPSRKAGVGLADALGMSNRPVTLYVSAKDMDALRRFSFFLEANVAGAEDVQEIRLAEGIDGQKAGGGDQARSTPIYSLTHDAKPIPDELFGTSRDEFYDLIASAHLTDEDEEKVFAAFVEIAKPILALIKSQYEKGERS
jgi:transcriptional regulator with XRE-family HTH domain